MIVTTIIMIITTIITIIIIITRRRRMEFSSGHSRWWLILTTVSRSNWNLEFWCMWRKENRRTWRKTPGTRTRTTTNSTHM